MSELGRVRLAVLAGLLLGASACATVPPAPAAPADRASTLAASRVLASISGADLVESVAPDPVGGGWYISSVASGQVYRVTPGGQISPWRAASMGSSGFGLAIDAPRRLLWAAWSRVDQTPGEGGFIGLVGYDLDSGAVRHRIALPDPAARVGDIAIAPNGRLFASDPINGALLTLAPDAEALSVLVPAGTLRSPQGIAVDHANQRLYVADYSRGIVMVPLDGSAVRPLSSTSAMELRGVDGLLLHRGHLIAIQNGTATHRIVRFSLSADGTAITSRTLLEQAHGAWDEPTNGYIVGDTLTYVGNSQWRRFGPGGRPTGNPVPEPTQLRALALD